MQRRDEAPALLPLFDAVTAAPGLDAPRQVLADALLEQGDVRGEFIALQLVTAQGRASSRQLERERELLRRHLGEWLAGLPGAEPGRTVFHRGFPRLVHWRPTAGAADSPAWRLVEQLELRPGRGDEGLLSSPELRSLRAVHGVDRLALASLLSGPARPALTALSLAGPDSERFQGELGALARFPLETLTVSPVPWVHHAARQAWLFEAPITARLRLLRFAVDPPWDIAGLEALLEERRLDALTLEVTAQGLTVRFTRRSAEVRFADDAAFRRHAQTVRNLAARLVPFPYLQLSARVGDDAAEPARLAALGPAFR